MINNLIKWAAKKRGYRLERVSGLVLVHNAPDITVFRMGVIEHGKGINVMRNLEGMAMTPGDTLNVYISNEGGK